MYNLSIVSNEQTAKTNIECAEQRADYLSILGAINVLELCVGPSLKTLETAYNRRGLTVTGNDIDKRWKHNYNKGRWLVGDALTLNYSVYDAVVFAPPLSSGCSGTRKDSLSINNVSPSYYSFLDKLTIDNYSGIFVMVLPGRSLSTRFDREQYFQLLYLLKIKCRFVESVPLVAGKKKIRKYVDVYGQL